MKLTLSGYSKFGKTETACFSCGKKTEGQLAIHILGGYGSDLDGQTIEISVCEPCLKAGLHKGVSKIVADANLGWQPPHPDQMTDAEKKKYSKKMLQRLRHIYNNQE